jgi:Zn-dependent peptidase ImmA (M78 family)
MSSPYKAAVRMAAAILLDYRQKFGDESFPTIKNKLWPIIAYQAGLNGVDNIYVKRFKEQMHPIVGQLRRIRERNDVYSPEEDHGVIYLCPSLNLDWQRFIEIKEASHLMLDKDEDFVHSDTDIDQLLKCLAQFGREGVTKQYFSETRAQVCAFELLFPKSTRDALLERYEKAEISPAQIAKAARIPADVVRTIMGARYRDMIDEAYAEIAAEAEATNVTSIKKA